MNYREKLSTNYRTQADRLRARSELLAATNDDADEAADNMLQAITSSLEYSEMTVDEVDEATNFIKELFRLDDSDKV